MKLLTKNTLLILAASLLVFLLGGFIFYQRLNTIIDEEATEALYLKKTQVELYITKHGALPVDPFMAESITFRSIPGAIAESVSDTMLYNTLEGEILPYRRLQFTVTLHGQYYLASVNKPLFESEDLVEAISTTLLIVSVLLVLVLLSISYLFSRRTWKPFFQTLDALGKYKIETHGVISLEPSGTKEFDLLNESIRQMTERISADFNNLKNFTENASHEIQTPLAIISNKIENLLQNQNLLKPQVEQLMSIHDTLNRLSKLNQGLLLLARIENGQFNTDQHINLSSLINHKLELYEDLFALKKIKLTPHIAPDAMVQMHPDLADSVISNLVSNALKYTPEGGHIDITLQNDALTVSNTGEALSSEPEQLFQRFYKEVPDSESTGLGLALVKQIANLHGHRVTYYYHEGKHCFTYNFVRSF
ncbi:MAG: HAMP domain-containing histidine kinase [Bacteroidetes bacterium]|nr:HAMP domain-containing histidine kinase [Bacteroidota bacterium]